MCICYCRHVHMHMSVHTYKHGILIYIVRDTYKHLSHVHIWYGGGFLTWRYPYTVQLQIAFFPWNRPSSYWWCPISPNPMGGARVVRTDGDIGEDGWPAWCRRMGDNGTNIDAETPDSSEQGITRVRFLHSSLHKKTSKWQDSTLCIFALGHAKLQTMTRLNLLHPSLGHAKLQTKTKKKTTLCLRHSGPVGLLGFLVVFFFFCFLILHECIIDLAPSLLLWTFCCSVLTHLALSHHPTPWKVSPCLLSHTSGYHPNVHVFLDFSWFGHPPRKNTYFGKRYGCMYAVCLPWLKQEKKINIIFKKWNPSF